MNRFGSRIVWCLLLLFGCISLISWHYLHNWRERVNVQMPTDNPLKAKLGHPVRNGGFARKGFNLWDPSIIKVGDTYHMFASCWTSEDFNAWKTSFIVRGTSKNLLGPYSFAGEVFRPRPGDFFDSEGCHNPKIAFHNGKYYLYYLGIPAWKSGVAERLVGPEQVEHQQHIPLLHGGTSHCCACSHHLAACYHEAMDRVGGLYSRMQH